MFSWAKIFFKNIVDGENIFGIVKKKFRLRNIFIRDPSPRDFSIMTLAIVVNPPERKLAKYTSVHWSKILHLYSFATSYPNLEQSWQKLDTILKKYLKNQNFSKMFINLSWSPNQIFLEERKLDGFNQFSTLKYDFENQKIWDLWQGCS